MNTMQIAGRLALGAVAVWAVVSGTWLALAPLAIGKVVLDLAGERELPRARSRPPRGRVRRWPPSRTSTR
jgi:hypothetical protein